jgi:hypothetical protein
MSVWISSVWISRWDTSSSCLLYMASQMNRDVTECFRLLIWIEFLTKRACVNKIFDENTSEFHQVSPGYPNGILWSNRWLSLAELLMNY